MICYQRYDETMSSSTGIMRRVNLSPISGMYSDAMRHGTDSSLPLHAQCYGNNETKENVAERRTIARQLTFPSPVNLQHGRRTVKNFYSSSLSTFSHNKSRINNAQSYQICQSRAFGLSSRTERAPQVAILAF